MKFGSKVQTFQTLSLSQQAGVFDFTPDWSMPDVLYYQSLTAKHLGGVIRLVDECRIKYGGDTTVPR